YYTSGLIELAAIDLYQTFKFERVIALREFDLIRAARIRDYLSLPGQKPKAVELFRDKFLMKNRAKKIGLKVPKFAKIDNTLDLLKFIKKVNYPIIIKPRKKAGNLGFKVLKNKKDFLQFIIEISGISDIEEPFDMLAEEYIEASMAHVDGLIHHGKIITINASEYLGYHAGIDFSPEKYFSMQYAGSLTIPTSSVKARKLFNYTRTLLNEFDNVNTYIFHAELWMDENGENILLNEIAARSGGSWVYKLLGALFIPSLEQCLFKYLCTEDETVFSLLPKHSKYCGFSGRIPLMPGTIISLPTHLSLSKSELYECEVKPGDKIKQPTSYYDHMGFIVKLGKTPAECLVRFKTTLAEFRNKIRMKH
ncbi:MAG: hypothetical protein WBE18_02505, partial [Gammaproteobacteria bacterium]